MTTLVDLVEALWIEPVHERRMVAVELLDLYVDRLRPDDAELLERLLRESRTWALVDGLAASVVGRLVERYDEMGTVLDRWAGDDDFWLRRSALLASSSHCVGATATSPASPATPTRCSMTTSSSSARPSAGCYATPRGSDRTSCTTGCFHVPLEPRR